MSVLRRGSWVLLGLGVAMQLVPVSREHENPPVLEEPDWDSPATRSRFFEACKDCHSNETEWPWYSFVAPTSWLVRHDVDEGRAHFNVSEWGRAKNHGDEAAEMVRQGSMPPWFYLPTHPEARLSDSERAEFVVGLIATFGDESDEDRELEVPRRPHADEHSH